MRDGATLTTGVLDDGTPVVSASGELDMRVAPRLAKRIARVARPGCGGVVLDLNAATFVDSTILGVIVGEARRLEHRGGALVVVTRRPNLRRVLDLTGLVRVFPVVDTREDALAAL